MKLSIEGTLKELSPLIKTLHGMTQSPAKAEPAPDIPVRIKPKTRPSGWMSIRDRRKRAGLTQRELGELVSRGTSTISHAETDPFSVSKNTLQSIADVFDCEIEEMV